MPEETLRAVPVGSRLGLGSTRRLPGKGGRHARTFLVPLSWTTVALVCGYMLPSLVDIYGARDLALILLGAVVAGVACLKPSFSVVLVVVTFVFSALLRRVAPAADPAVDLAAIVPFLVMFPLAAHGLRTRMPLSVVLFVAWATVSAALSLATPLVGLAGWMNLALPLLAAFGVVRVPDGRRLLVRTTVVCGSVAAAYGIAQYFVPFSWDVNWVERSGFLTAGSFGTENFRPFATYPAPSTAAITTTVVILLLLFRRELLGLSPLVRTLTLSCSVAFLLLTQVRSAWVAAGVAVMVGALTASGRSARQVAAPVGIVVAFLFVFPQGDLIVERAQTFTNLESDISYRSRLNLLNQADRLLSPFGTGVGTLSAGSRVEADASIDNGYMVVLGELGVVGLALFLWVLAVMIRTSERSNYTFISVLFVLTASGVPFTGFAGLVLWSLCGLSGAADTADEGSAAVLTPAAAA